MDQNLSIEFFLYGILLNSLCLFGLIANILTLYVLNASREMRRQPINMFLTVLAIYDKGVLLNAILMCGIPALAKYSSTGNNFINSNLFNNLTIPKYLNSTDFNLNRTSRSTLTQEQLQDNQFFIDLTSENKQFLIENQLIDDLNESNLSNLLDFKNFNKTEILIYLNQGEAMAQINQQAFLTNQSDLPSFNNFNHNLTLADDQTILLSTFASMMNRIADFFQGYILIIYPLANISQTGSIFITCLITGN